MNKKILNLCKELALERCLIKNKCNGRAYMSAFIVDKSTRYVLRERYKRVSG